MLTSKLLSYYNHLLATTVFYSTALHTLRDLTSNFDLDEDYGRFSLLVSASSDSNRDHYEILGVSEEASKAQIHQAFRKLAKKYHPDKNKDRGAQDEFIRILEAYETLSDENKRSVYDDERTMGKNGFRGGKRTTQWDFDMEEFFRQYGDQLFEQAHDLHEQSQTKHDRSQQNSIHDRFSFHGFDLGDLMQNSHGNEFQPFDHEFGFSNYNHDNIRLTDDTFGDGASFFGSQIYDSLLQHGSAGNLFVANFGTGKSCETISRQVNGVMMTQTSCA